MSKPAFKNSELGITTIAATEVKNAFGSVLDRAMQEGAVAITRHNLPKAVLMSYDEYKSLVRDHSRILNDLGNEFDALLDRMQTAQAKKGMKAAFNAPPAQLGHAAVEFARKSR